MFYKSEKYLSHPNKSGGLISGLYKFVRKINLGTKYKIIKGYNSKPGTLLDIGCGTGEFLRFMHEQGWQTQGIERDEDARKYALAVNKIEAGPMSTIAEIPDSSLDVITMWHVLEHIYDPRGLLNELHRMIKPQGNMFFAVPNSASWDATKFHSYWAAYDLPRHVHHYSRSSMSILLEGHGLQISEILPMKFDSFYISLLSEKYKTGRSNYIKAFVNGFRSNNYGFNHNKEYSSIIFVAKMA